MSTHNIKDHQITKLVNDLRDLAVSFGQTEQLRERLSHRVHEFLKETEVKDTCTVPPKGWTCSRPAGHEGPCAASPVEAPMIACGGIDQEIDEEEGYVLLRVKGLPELYEALYRAQSKGYLPDAIKDEYDNLDWKAPR